MNQIADVANDLGGVLGADLIGTGGGGYVLLLARAGLLPALRDHLKQGYYDVICKQPEVEAGDPRPQPAGSPDRIAPACVPLQGGSRAGAACPRS